MRKIIHKQLRIVEPLIDHEHAQELYQIKTVISEYPGILELVHEDLIRGLDEPETGRKGMMTAEQVFKVMLIKQMNGFSYKVLRYHLEDSRTYGWFCGFGIGEMIPSESTLQRDIKKLRPETLEEINRIILGAAADKKIEKGRKVRVDCTVTESNIHHPTDSSLLEDGVRVLTRLMTRAKERFGDIDIVFTNHHRCARKRALGILNSRKKKQTTLYRDLINIARKTVSYAGNTAGLLESEGRKLESIAEMLLARGIAEELRHFIPLVEQVISQAERRVLLGETLPPAEKVVSIFEPHTDIIRKDRRETYFGHKLAITGGASGLLTDLVIEKGNPADSTIAGKMITRQKDIYGRYPRQATFDGAFASRDNLKSIKVLGVKDVAFARKRGLEVSDMAKSTWVYKRLRNFRAGIEGMISFLKRCFGLCRCMWRGFESFKSYAWSSVVTANLLLLSRRLRA